MEKEKTLPYGKMVPNKGKGYGEFGKTPHVNYYGYDGFGKQSPTDAGPRVRA